MGPGSHGTVAKAWEGGYQPAINYMERAALAIGAFRTTPVGIVAVESAFTPTRALLDHRRARFAQRLDQTREGRRPRGSARAAAEPDGGAPGGGGIMDRRDGEATGVGQDADLPGHGICICREGGGRQADGKTGTIPSGRVGLE